MVGRWLRCQKPVTGRKGGSGGSVRKTIFLSPQLIAEVDAEAEAEYGRGAEDQVNETCGV